MAPVTATELPTDGVVRGWLSASAAATGRKEPVQSSSCRSRGPHSPAGNLHLPAHLPDVPFRLKMAAATQLSWKLVGVIGVLPHRLKNTNSMKGKQRLEQVEE